jgi:hypothetical protein
VDRDRESLRLAVEDVDYEFEQLVNLAREMVRQDDQFKSPSRGALEYEITATISIACLESALLHVRNLLAFVDPSEESWINIRDYAAKWSPRNSDALKRLRNKRDLLNAHLSHLSWKRVTERAETGANPGWNVWELADDVLTVFTDFVARLQEDDGEAAGWFSGPLAVASMKLRGEWPAILSKPAAGSPLAVYVPGMERRKA